MDVTLSRGSTYQGSQRAADEADPRRHYQLVLRGALTTTF